jgi:tetratricopeptide (TPR) repeat protein
VKDSVEGGYLSRPPTQTDSPAALRHPVAARVNRLGRWLGWACPATVVVVTGAVLSGSLRNDFVNFDDIENFLRNPSYRGLKWSNLVWMFTSAKLGHYIPVTWFTLGVDYILWGMNPWGYHLTSLLLHTLNAVLVYVLALCLFKLALVDRPAQRGASAETSVGLRLGAALAALLFSAHPLRVESVAWITERRDVVAGLFTCLVVLTYLESWRRGSRNALDRRWLAGSVLLLGLALLSKSIVVGLPLVLLTLDIYPLRRFQSLAGSPGHRLLPLLKEKIPFFVESATIVVVMFIIGIRRELLTPLDALSLDERVAISAFSLIFYLIKTLLPWPLSPLYELHYPISLFSARYVVAAAATAGITVFVISGRRRWPALLAAWVTYVALLLPVIGITHNGTQIAADRYSYLATVPIALIAGGALASSLRARLSGTSPARTTCLAVLLAVVGVASMAALTPLQVRVWHDSETLWRHALAVDPRSGFAHFHLAGALWLAGRPAEAQGEFERALVLIPDRLGNAKAAVHASLGLLLQVRGEISEAERHYRSALAFSEENVLALANLGVVYANRGQLVAALELFRRALRVMPGDATACLYGRQVATLLAVSPIEIASCLPQSNEERSVQKQDRGRGDSLSSPAGAPSLVILGVSSLRTKPPCPCCSEASWAACRQTRTRAESG